MGRESTHAPRKRCGSVDTADPRLPFLQWRRRPRLLHPRFLLRRRPSPPRPQQRDCARGGRSPARSSSTSRRSCTASAARHGVVTPLPPSLTAASYCLVCVRLDQVIRAGLHDWSDIVAVRPTCAWPKVAEAPLPAAFQLPRAIAMDEAMNLPDLYDLFRSQAELPTRARGQELAAAAAAEPTEGTNPTHCIISCTRLLHVPPLEPHNLGLCAVAMGEVGWEAQEQMENEALISGEDRRYTAHRPRKIADVSSSPACTARSFSR